jgi:ribosomal protein S18 acetylase RimI-like enzyme
MTLQLRPMTDDEYEAWQVELAEAFVAEAIAAGRAMPDDAVQRELEDNAAMLPRRAATPRMLVVTAVDADGLRVGRAWVALDHPRGSPDTAFIYDIEVDAGHRGQGLGKELLAALERAVAEAGVGSLELNVFGNNAPALKLYESAGFTVTSQQMRKVLEP